MHINAGIAWQWSVCIVYKYIRVDEQFSKMCIYCGIRTSFFDELLDDSEFFFLLFPAIWNSV